MKKKEYRPPSPTPSNQGSLRFFSFSTVTFFFLLTLPHNSNSNHPHNSQDKQFKVNTKNTSPAPCESFPESPAFPSPVSPRPFHHQPRLDIAADIPRVSVPLARPVSPPPSYSIIAVSPPFAPLLPLTSPTLFIIFFHLLTLLSLLCL